MDANAFQRLLFYFQQVETSFPMSGRDASDEWK